MPESKNEPQACSRTVSKGLYWRSIPALPWNVMGRAMQTFDYVAVVNRALEVQRTTADLAVLILLHEFRHTPLGGNAPQETNFKEYNLPICEKCVRQ